MQKKKFCRLDWALSSENASQLDNKLLDQSELLVHLNLGNYELLGELTLTNSSWA